MSEAWKFEIPEGIDDDLYEDDLGTLEDANGNVICYFGDSTTYYNTCGAPPDKEYRHMIEQAPVMQSTITRLTAENGRLREALKEVPSQIRELAPFPPASSNTNATIIKMADVMQAFINQALNETKETNVQD